MKNNQFLREEHIHYAEKLITAYPGGEPFAAYLKKYFSLNKKHGANDRRQISALCYGYFRLGNGAPDILTITEKIRTGYQLTYKPAGIFQDTSVLPLDQRLKSVTTVFDPKKIFPFADALSKSIDREKFNLSFLIQPLLFIRVRPGYEEEVPSTLKRSGIPYHRYSDHCIALPISTSLRETIDINKRAVVQDYDSQLLSLFYKSIPLPSNRKIHVWDCCAASGGKAILAVDYFKNIDLTVTDKRKTILVNLSKRFKEAGISEYFSREVDLSTGTPDLPGAPFDLIIADVPCSGSGTWSRTPEQLLFFNHDKIKEYAELQQKIVENAIEILKPDGYLLYVTCSVFSAENEDNVDFICTNFGMKVLKQKYMEGYTLQADTLFAALLKFK